MNHRIWLLFILTTISSSCSYKFSNFTFSNKLKWKKIFIENLTSPQQSLIPDEAIWQELQLGFIKRSPLTVTNRSNADIFLRIELEKSSRKYEQPKVGQKFIPNNSNISTRPAPSPKKFRYSKKSSNYAQSEKITLSCKVQLWDLKTKQLILHKKYFFEENLALLSNKVPAESQLLYLMEQEENSVKKIGKRLADSIILDLFFTVKMT